jgi:tRNA A-37 threonylcarbamoyl transferase component Bud32
MRHIDKTFFLGPDPRFYEPNYAHYSPSSELIDLIEPMLAAHGRGWTTRRADVWTHILPPPTDPSSCLPAQGWKIHVSAHTGNCRALLVKVATLALEHDIQFKFANDVDTLRLMTSKRWARGGSGKFITLYPPTEAIFRDFIELAYRVLKDDVGSYILSDRRYKDCRCLYYRYGGIIAVSRIGYMGQKQPLLISPQGEEIVDRRTPYFESPPWAPDPFPDTQPDLEQEEMTLDNGRYLVKSALGFSNTGGVYLATDTTTGADVVIKEARPHVELGVNGLDATGRLQREAKMLELLEGISITPKLLGSFQDWENFYLVEEYFDAYDMREVMVMHTPILRVAPTRAESEAFYVSYRRMFTSVLDAIDRIHAQGVVIGDLSPMNILVEKSSMTVRIIDLEGAFQPLLEDAQEIHTPGFRLESKGRKDESDQRDDIYAIGAIMMYSMFPIAAMAFLRTDLFSRVLPVLVADMGWSDTPVRQVIEGLVGNSIGCREAIALLQGPASVEAPMSRAQRVPMTPARTRDELGRFIVHHHRQKPLFTLFPLDPFGSEHHPNGFGFGAAGIIHSLRRCGVAVPEAALVRHARELAAIAPGDIAPGFLVGAAGRPACRRQALHRHGQCQSAGAHPSLALLRHGRHWHGQPGRVRHPRGATLP